MGDEPQPRRARRYTQLELDQAVDGARAASVGETRGLNDKLNNIDTKLELFMQAVVGEPGVSKGALTEIREAIADEVRAREDLSAQWKLTQTELPVMIQATIAAENSKRRREVFHDFTKRGRVVALAGSAFVAALASICWNVISIIRTTH